MKRNLLFLLVLFIGKTVFAQNAFEAGAEYMRHYGKGYQTSRAGLRAETFPSKTSFSIGLLYTLPSKNAYSVAHGFSLYGGIRYSFSNNILIKGSSPFVGARGILTMENFEGKTNLFSFLFTPMAELGYHFLFAKKIFTSPSIGYGHTIKLTKEYNSLDEDIGGRIIPSISAGFRL